MGTISERFGKFDDDSAIYTATDGAQTHNWWKHVLAYIVATGLAGAWLALVPEPMNFITLGVVIAVFLIGYVVWRRRRNERLTGSSTEWPGRASERGRDSPGSSSR